MNERVIILLFSIVILGLFAISFNDKWTDKTFEKVKNKEYTWYWLRLFGVKETKENYVKMIRGLSVFAIVVTCLGIIISLVKR